MTDTFARIAGKIIKQVLKAGIKKVFPPFGLITDGIVEPSVDFLNNILKEQNFEKEYKETIDKLYPGKYDLINTYVGVITENYDLYQILIDEGLDCKNAANSLMEKYKSKNKKDTIGDVEEAGIKTGLIFLLGKSSEILCSLEDKDIRKWLVAQTSKNGHAINEQGIVIADLKNEFKKSSNIYTQLLEELKKQVEKQDARLSKLENSAISVNYDLVNLFKEKWTEPLFLEEGTGQSVKKTLKDVYFPPMAKRGGENGQPEQLDNLLKEEKGRFVLILGKPGIGKSSFVTASLNGEFDMQKENCSVFAFADFKSADCWRETETEASIGAERFLTMIGCWPAENLNERVIFLDGFDEISVMADKRIEFLKQLYKRISFTRIQNCKVFVTCRENYMESEAVRKAGFPAYEMLPFGEGGIKEFCKKYGDVTETAINTLLKKKDIYGFPIVLYMALATKSYETAAKNTVEIYKELFKRVYDREWDFSSGEHSHTTSHCDFYDKLAQKMAVYMFEHDDAEAGCPKEVVEEYGKELKNELRINYDIPVLIGGFYKAAKKGTNVFFVHRTIYEYFFTKYLKETVENSKEKKDGWFLSNFFEKIQFRQLSEEMLRYFFDHVGTKKEDLVGTIKEELEKALYKEQLSLEHRFLQKSKYEAYVLVNCQSMISRAYEGSGYWKVNSKNFADYLRLISHAVSDVRFILSNGNLEEANLKGANLRWAHLEGANLRWANLQEANLERVHLERAHLERTHMEGAHLEGAHLKGANLEGANLDEVNLQDANLEGANLEGANLEKVNLLTANLEGANLEGANLEKAQMSWLNLDGVDLEGANLQGANLERVGLIRANMKRANLNCAYCTRANLHGANLQGANLSGTHLSVASLSGADLERANLQYAHLEGANLQEANLHGANLKWAHLEGAYLEGTHLEGALINEHTKFPEEFDIKGKDMLIETPDGQRKSIDSIKTDNG